MTSWSIPDALAEQLPARLVGRLHLLTRWARKKRFDDGCFDLGAREAGRIWGCSKSTAGRSLLALETAGALELLSAGKYSPDHKIAARWRFSDRLFWSYPQAEQKGRSQAARQSQKWDCDSPKNGTHVLLTTFVEQSVPQPAVAVAAATPPHPYPCPCDLCVAWIERRAAPRTEHPCESSRSDSPSPWRSPGSQTWRTQQVAAARSTNHSLRPPGYP